jgi:hypothetical protein
MTPRQETENTNAEENTGSPQFHALQRKNKQDGRTIRILAVVLTICVVALGTTIYMLMNR